ncbi:MAG: GNAT family N-acetyltransferase; N-acetyltransferase [Hydrogenophaga sp.]
MFHASPRLRLREFETSDLVDLCTMHQNARVRELLMDDYPLDAAEKAFVFLKAMRLIYEDHPGYGIWHCSGLIDKCWRFCGWANLLPIAGESGVAEIGCRLLPDAWGRGVAWDIGSALLDHAFERLSLPVVRGYCHPKNRSVKVTLFSLGFAYRGASDYDGAVADMFDVEAEQWKIVRQSPRRIRQREGVRQWRSEWSAV